MDNKLFNNIGSVIILDLNNFKKICDLMNWVNHLPNIITRSLTNLVDDFLYKFNGICLWGLDFKRGTEEAIIVTFFDISDFLLDLKMIQNDTK